MITSVCQSEESSEVSEESFMHSMCDGPLSGGQQAAMVQMQLNTYRAVQRRQPALGVNRTGKSAVLGIADSCTAKTTKSPYAHGLLLDTDFPFFNSQVAIHSIDSWFSLI